VFTNQNVPKPMILPIRISGYVRVERHVSSERFFHFLPYVWSTSFRPPLAGSSIHSPDRRSTWPRSGYSIAGLILRSDLILDPIADPLGRDPFIQSSRTWATPIITIHFLRKILIPLCHIGSHAIVPTINVRVLKLRAPKIM